MNESKGSISKGGNDTLLQSCTHDFLTPFKIAEYLTFSKPFSYTGHNFRRTLTLLLIEGWGDVRAWKSWAVAEGYLDDSIWKEYKVAHQIITGCEKSVSTSACENINKVYINTILNCSSKCSLAISCLIIYKLYY